ncbi:uncharacterized protein LOC107466277 isoform X1 [Arachis duranensis]|uniref:Uncharacterized protein LOC107466277 isoform X1 n=2 Tax=Arachis duranensis TaxID=130453 RepID=A0A9C6T5W4_ARADU|nr:uncharacterized protein LOC107466277 isoform X1 [Arachis duranensis]
MENNMQEFQFSTAIKRIIVLTCNVILGHLFLKMSTESKTVKAENDFKLVVNYSKHCVWKDLKKDSSGAGANAASRVNMSLSALDPLSEIVWSPNTGFSLNCVDSSFANRNSNLYQDVRPSSMVFALLHGGISNTDLPIDDVFVNPITVICAKSDVTSADDPSRVITPECQAPKENDTDEVDERPVDKFLTQDDNKPNPSMEENPSPRKLCNGGMGLASKAPIEKLESTADNDLQTLNNCAALFLTGKKRCKLQQELTTGGKRVKKQTQESSCSRSMEIPETSDPRSRTRQNSSFMNLVSNMMKGFSQSASNPDHHLLWDHDQIQNHNPEPKSTGLKSDFKCMSCPIKSHQGLDVTPISCCAENNNSLYKQYLQSREFEVKIRPVNFHSSHENRTNKEGKAINSFPTIQDQNNNESAESYAPSERKVTDNFLNKIDTFGGVWMNRFLPKSSAQLITFDNSVLPNSHKHFSYLKETKEQCVDDDHFLKKEASVDDTPKVGFNPITPFPGFKDSEPMAAMFARRLGAIRHITRDATYNLPHRHQN